MTDLEALYRAVLAEPDDDTRRLVYADCVEEMGDPERAELIRLQCRLAHMRPDDAEIEDVRSGVSWLIATSEWRWISESLGCARIQWERGFACLSVSRMEDLWQGIGPPISPRRPTPFLLEAVRHHVTAVVPQCAFGGDRIREYGGGDDRYLILPNHYPPAVWRHIAHDPETNTGIETKDRALAEHIIGRANVLAALEWADANSELVTTA